MDRSNLARMLSPATVAVVGASENLGMSNNAVLPMLDAGIEPKLVNPNRPSVYDRPTFPSLSAMGEPVDAVLALVNAERSVEVVEEAAALGCGGVVVAAGGFGELREHGAALEDRLRSVTAEAGLAVVGPNCSGFMNVPRRVNLFTGGRIALNPGPIAVVSQSGFLVRACLAAGQGRQLGYSIAVSSGNETVCGLEDYVETLTDDPQTSVICLVVEKIRQADRFFDAVARARAAGKAVLAVKLGRTATARQIMRSHTGAIADESWVYELGFRQAGVHTGRDIDEMLDMAQLLAQLPPERWRPIRGVGVVTSSGGVAAVAADTAADQGVSLPVPAEAATWLRDTIPGEGTLNPLDMTGFVMRDRDLLESLFDRLSRDPAIDAVVLCWWAAEGDEGWSRTLLEPYATVAARQDKPLIVTPVEATSIGAWTAEFRKDGLTFCRGIESTFRALRALDRTAIAGAAAAARPQEPGPAATRPPSVIPTPAGELVPFAEAMELLANAGFAVAPYVVLGPGEDTHQRVESLGARLAVKLADVPHRTELGAVKVGVSPSGLRDTVRELRRIADQHGVPGTIAVQQMIDGHGEAFIGLQGRTDLGPVLLLGRGGVLVEAANEVRGRLLRRTSGAEDGLAADVASIQVRGEGEWSVEALDDALGAAERLWDATRGWLSSADVNPLIVTDHGLVAVDVLLLAAPVNDMDQTGGGP
jgi:acetate---CoA ligase (ADP-forming)